MYRGLVGVCVLYYPTGILFLATYILEVAIGIYIRSICLCTHRVKTGFSCRYFPRSQGLAPPDREGYRLINHSPRITDKRLIFNFS